MTENNQGRITGTTEIHRHRDQEEAVIIFRVSCISAKSVYFKKHKLANGIMHRDSFIVASFPQVHFHMSVHLMETNHASLVLVRLVWSLSGVWSRAPSAPVPT